MPMKTEGIKMKQLSREINYFVGHMSVSRQLSWRYANQQTAYVSYVLSWD